MSAGDLKIEAAVIGAGVIGLAIARALARAGLETIVLEQAPHIGSETSSRNSEVIHAGIYYPPDSLKAKLCVRGRDLLYQYLSDHHLPYARCGKLVVANNKAQALQLASIGDRARHCGVTNLVYLSKDEVANLEPDVQAESALYSPSTGIVDSHQLMLALQGDLESAGGNVAFSTTVAGGRLCADGDHLLCTAGENSAQLGCRFLVNASGLHARKTWLSLLGEADKREVPRQYFAKGHYYSYPGQAPFNHLIYPIPAQAGLGIHATLDLVGQVRFGPDVRWVDKVDYDFDDSRRAEFVRAVETYFPGLEPDRLQPAYTGIRPKVVAEGEANGDFLILDARKHGVSGFVSLHGIESPGLTACLAIAEDVVARLHCA